MYHVRRFPNPHFKVPHGADATRGGGTCGAWQGLEGDRYYDGRGTFSPQPQKVDFELTLVEEERIEAFAREFDLDFTAAHARRNVVTRGVDLNALNLTVLFLPFFTSLENFWALGTKSRCYY